MNKNEVRGIVSVMIAAILWGICGSCGQFLFQTKNFSPTWTVTIRLLTSGCALLLLAFKQKKKEIFKILKNKNELFHLIIFSIFGMMAVQYTYFVCIEKSNATTATVLQYLAPAMVMIFISFKKKKIPNVFELTAICFALLGTFFLSTHGNINSLSLSKSALIWGIASALTYAFYTVYPENMLKKYGSFVVMGYGMFFGGLFLSFKYIPWQSSATFDTASIITLLFIIIGGTVTPFTLFSEGVQAIGPTKSSLLASIEPVASAFISVICLNVSFVTFDYIGFFLIVSTVFLLSLKPKKDTKQVLSNNYNN